MTIISSQHYINPEIVAEKIEQLTAAGAKSVIVPCSYVGIIDGVEYAIQTDKHHTLSAARELDLPVEYKITDDPEGLTGIDLLEARYYDGDYYDVERSNPYYDEIVTVW